MGIHIFRGYFNTQEHSTNDIGQEMMDWAERARTDYMPAEYGYLNPVFFIHPDGICEVLRDGYEDDPDWKQLMTVNGINKYFNDNYGPAKVKQSIAIVRKALSQPNIDDTVIAKLPQHFAKIYHGGRFINKPIDVRDDEFNPWNFTFTNTDIDDSITNAHDTYGDYLDIKPQDEYHYCFLLVLNAGF